MQNLSYEQQFDLYENEPVVKKHFHTNGFAIRLLLTQRQEATRKWPVTLSARKTKGESHFKGRCYEMNIHCSA